MCIYNNIIVRIGTEEINAVILHSNIIFIKTFIKFALGGL